MTINFLPKFDGTNTTFYGPTLYKLDSKGKLREWRMELLDDGRYRTVSGLAGGKQAESKWTVPVPKSRPTVKEQGEFEVQSQYQHQLDREYHLTKDTVETPKMIEPMLAKTYKEWPGPGWAQPKLDGIRCIMNAAGMWTRQGQPIVAVPHLHDAARSLFRHNPDLILDGELYNHDLRDDFGAISSIVRKKNPTAEQLEKAEAVMQYHVYDLVEPQHTQEVRNLRLLELLRAEILGIIPVMTYHCISKEQADSAYAKFIGDGYEGGMYRLDARYQLGKRSEFLLKRKEFITREFRVKNIEAGTGNWAGAAKRYTLINDNGSEFGAGTRGSYDANKKILDEYCPGMPATATVRYFELTPDGVPRFGVVIDFQPDGIRHD